MHTTLNTTRSVLSITIAAAALATLGCGGAAADRGATASRPPAVPRAVALADASSPPRELTMLAPGARITYGDPATGYTCHLGRKGYFTNTSAYTWRGGKLGPQRWTRDHTVQTWRGRRGRVEFDGITFRNRTSQPVLVAGWCD